MIKLFKFMFVLVLLINNTLLAAEPSKEQIKRLLEITNLDTNLAKAISGWHENFDEQLKNMSVEENKRSKITKNIVQHIEQEFTADKITSQLVDAYSKNFDEKELEDLIAFYQSKTGQSLIRIAEKTAGNKKYITEDLNKFLIQNLSEQELQEVNKFQTSSLGIKAQKVSAVINQNLQQTIMPAVERILRQELQQK